MTHTSDFLVIGGGIIGLSTAKALLEKYPGSSITLLEKEDNVAKHASGRNSGVLHAGFYYSADSLKAKFCRQGNIQMHDYCDANGIRVNRCGKLVVAVTEAEIEGLRELKRRGDVNSVPVEIITRAEAEKIEPNVRTVDNALWSPTTSSVDPVVICRHIRDMLVSRGVKVLTGMVYEKRIAGNKIQASGEVFEAERIINCAGLYADKVARDFGFCEDYTILPFKGVYLKNTAPTQPLRTLLYTVPDMKKPFLGVHFAMTVDGLVKIGPTAIPAFWREQYKGIGGFKLTELLSIVRWQSELFLRDSFGFRRHAIDEIRKYYRPYLISHAARMAKHIDAKAFSEWSTPGIRAQLLNTKTLNLVQDFTVEGDDRSVHVLNAVSPAFTSGLPMGQHVVSEFIK